MKPLIYLANIKESDMGKPNPYVDIVRDIAKRRSEVIEMC